jgi:tRNA A-37 threonylcarbamoyl transferase component Bud32
MKQPASATTNSKVCPACGESFSADVVNCPRDEILLIARDPLIGQVLDNRYEVVEFVGQGGMSLVYKASQKQLDRAVAIKLLKPEYLSDAANVQRFRREAMAASALQHPNINAVYAVGVTKTGQPYLVLEFLDGRSLAAVLATDKPLEMQRALRIFTQTLDGLAQAHTRGVIHRDLKPSNIVVTVDADGHELVKVVDFGTAKLSAQLSTKQQQLTQVGEVLGTLQYMSPEQKRGQSVDARSDVYSVAYMLYEAVENEGTVPDQLRAIVEKGLAEDVGERYQTAVEMRNDLAGLMQHGVAAPVAKPSPGRVLFRYKKPAILLAVVSLVVAAFVAKIAMSPIDWLTFKYQWLKVTHAAPESLAAAVSQWAKAEADRGDLAEAEIIYLRETAALMPSSNETTQADLLLGLGQIYLLGKDGRKAEALIDRIGELGPAVKEAHHTEEYRHILYDKWILDRGLQQLAPITNGKIKRLHELARNFASKKFFDDSDIAFASASELAASTPDLEDSEYNILFDWLHVFIVNHRNTDQMYKVNERLCQLAERRTTPYTRDNVHLLLIRSRMYRNQANYRQADDVLRQAIPIMEPEHPLLADAYADLAWSMRERDRRDASELFLYKGFEASKKFAMSPQALARSYSMLGENVQKRDGNAAALAYFERAYEAGGDEVFALPGCEYLANNLTLCLQQSHQFAKLEAIAQAALRVAAKQHIENRPEMLKVKARLARLYKRQESQTTSTDSIKPKEK